MKDIYFLSGMPRSGNTVLSAILNQNPDVYSSELSPVSTMLFNLDKSITVSQNTNRSKLNKERVNKTMSNLVHEYYSDIDKQHIFDREKFWATPENFNMILKYITKSPKFIFTVRPLLEVLASYITIMPYNIKKDMYNIGWKYKTFLTENDNMCDFLMTSEKSSLKGFFESYITINDPRYKEMFHIVEYSSLVANPQKTMNEIYDFIGIENYIHDFSNIESKEKINDEQIGLPADLHKVRSELSPSTIKPEDCLSDYILTKYSTMDFWKK